MIWIASFKRKTTLLNALAAAVIILFVCLGNWQLSRAHEKKMLLKSFVDRSARSPLHARALSMMTDLRFYPAQFKGHFDNEHTLLLDNKIQDGKIGYEVYTPFKADDWPDPILVDRGFVPLGSTRERLPAIKPRPGPVSITGLFNLPPRYFSFSHQMIDPSVATHWPLRIEYLNIRELQKWFPLPFFPLILNLSPEDPAAYDVKWQILTMGPEKHMGYAIQWFAFALTLLIISVALNYSANKNQKDKIL